MKPKFQTSSRILTSLILLCGAQAQAIDFYWDANGATTAATGGTGNWNTTANLWRSGSDTGTLGPWANGNSAILGGTAGTLTTNSAVQVNQIHVLSSATGATYTLAQGTGGTLAFSGPNKTINVASGKTLSFGNFQTTQVSASGETALLTVQGGGAVTFTRINRSYVGSVASTGAGTSITFSATNGLDDGSITTGLNVREGGTIAVNGTNNYRTGLNLGAASLGGGTLKLGHVSALAGQSGMSFTVNGTSKSTVLSTMANTDANFGGINGNTTTRNFTVNSTGDASGVDLEFSAGWRNATLNKLGAGVFRLNNGFTINRSLDYTTFLYANTALSIGAGTFLNEGTVKSMTVVNGGTLKTGASSGVFDAVTVNTGGTFELSRESGMFTPGLAFDINQNSLTLNGGTLKYMGIAPDITPSINALGANGGIIDTNSQNVTFATGLTGTGGLTKNGAGTLTLDVANSFTGPTTVNSGTLVIGASGSIGSTVVDVRTGGILDVSAMPGGLVMSAAGSILTGTGTSLVTGNLALTAGTEVRPGGLNAIGTTAITGDLALAGSYRPDLDSASNDLLTVSGTANLAGATIRPDTTLPIPSKTYTILNYGTQTGTPVIDPAFAASRYNPTLNLGPQISAGSVTLTIAGNLANLVWSGENSALWNNNSAVNWTNGGSDDVFKPLDSVTFDDTAVGNFTIDIPAEVSQSGMIFENDINHYTLAGVGFIAGTGGLEKNGSGTVVLATNNTFSGPISNANSLGILQIGNGGTSGAIGSGAISNSGKIIFNRSDDYTASNVISGNGNLEKLGAGKLTLTSANTFAGGTAINGGALSISADNRLGTAPASLAAGHLTLNGTLEVTGVTTLAANRGLVLGPLDAVGSATISVQTLASETVTYTGILANNGTSATSGLVKTGVGRLSLGGNNTYTGPTSIQAGAILCTKFNALGADTSGTTVASGAWIYLISGANAAPFAEPLTLAGNGEGSGVVRVGGGAIRHTISAPITLTAASTIFNDGTAAVDLTNTVTGTNTDLTFVNGTSLNCTLSGSLSLGSGGFTKDGGVTTILAADNSYGATTISGGILQIGSGGTAGTLGSGAITNNGTLTLNRSDTHTVANVISGSGALTIAGSGTMILSGNNTYAGATNINAGTLLLSGSHANGAGYVVASTATLGGTGATTADVSLSGAISPGASIGTLSTGALALNNNSTLDIEINTSTATADKIVVTGNVTRPGATANLVLTDLGADALLPVGTKLTLVDYSGTWDPTKVLYFAGNPVANGSTITLGANTFTVKYDDDTALTLSTGSPFDAWIAGFNTQLTNPADRLPGADPDADGVNNLAEFALKGDPASGSNNGLVAVLIQDTDLPADTRELTLIAAVRRGAVFAANANNAQLGTKDAISYTVEGGISLASWTSAVTAIAAATDTAPAASCLIENLAGTDWQYRTFTLDASEGLAGKGFLRINISQ